MHIRFFPVSMYLFGSNALAIRLPSAIAGILLIPVIYFIGKEYRDELFGLLMAAYAIVIYTLFYYSRYGRSYSLALLFFSLAFYFLLRISKDDKRASFWFGVFALLSVWTHLYTVIPLGVMILYLLWERKAFSGIVLFFVGAIPLLNYINLINTTRVTGIGGQVFGDLPIDILWKTPFDLLGYSGAVTFPIIIWSLWKHRSDKIFRLITYVMVVTWGGMVVLSFRTPMILHYSLFLVPLLLIPLIVPFYDAIREKGTDMSFSYILIAITVLIIEFVQIGWIYTIQRVGP